MGTIPGRPHPQVEGDGVMDAFTMARAEGMMTAGHGFGLLLTGLIVMAIAGTIMYLTVNAIEDNRIKQEQERKQREKVDGLD